MAQVQPDLTEPTHPDHSPLTPFFPSDESRPPRGSHPGALCSGREPSRWKPALQSSVQQEHEVKQLLLFLLLPSLPLLGLESSMLSTHMCESRGQAPCRSRSRILWQELGEREIQCCTCSHCLLSLLGCQRQQRPSSLIALSPLLCLPLEAHLVPPGSACEKVQG